MCVHTSVEPAQTACRACLKRLPNPKVFAVPCREAIFLWRVNKLDFLVWVTAFIIVVFAGVEAGLASAVGLSLLIVLWKVPANRNLPPVVFHLLLQHALAKNVALAVAL